MRMAEVIQARAWPRIVEAQEPLRTGTVPHSWLGITKRMDTKSLLALRKAVDAAGVDENDREAVKVVWDNLVSTAEERLAVQQAEAARDHAEYQQRAAARKAEMDSLGQTFKNLPKRREG